MNKIWFKGLSEAEKNDLKDSYRESFKIRRELVRVLKSKRLDAIEKRYNENGYECPNWAYKQADNAGYVRALKEIINLID